MYAGYVLLLVLGAGARTAPGGGGPATALGRRDVGDCGLVFTTRRTCASLLVTLEVPPRVAMAVLRHSRIALPMEVYSQVSSHATRDALRQLGGRLGDGSAL